MGIDPGVTGAIAVIGDGDAFVHDAPRDADGMSGRALHQLILHYAPDEIYVERTHAMPKNGSKAAYSLGDSNGSIRTACHIAEVPLIWVRPQEWKRHFSLLGGALSDTERKLRSRQRAMEMFPTMALERVKDHNRAEALLIARYGADTSITKAVVGG